MRHGIVIQYEKVMSQDPFSEAECANAYYDTLFWLSPAYAPMQPRSQTSRYLTDPR